MYLAYRSKFFEAVKGTRPCGAKGCAEEERNKPGFPDMVEDDSDGDADEAVGDNSGVDDDNHLESNDDVHNYHPIMIPQSCQEHLSVFIFSMLFIFIVFIIL